MRARDDVVRSTYGRRLARIGKEAGDFVTAADVDVEGAVLRVHFAAGIVLCRAPGCMVTGIDGAPIGQTGCGLVVASEGAAHQLLMSVIRSRS
ncbi:hypothetical protein [Streptomyces sp. NPDC000994]